MSDLNNFNIMRAGQLMGGIVALEGLYDLGTSLQKTNPNQKKILQNRGFNQIIGGAIAAGLFSIFPLKISHFPIAVQPFLSKNLNVILPVTGAMMLAFGVEQVYKASHESNESERAELTKKGFGQAIYGSAALLARVWS